MGNKPILFYGLEDIASAGVKKEVGSSSPRRRVTRFVAVGDGTRFGLTEVEYIVQDRPAGLAHALKTALPWVDGDDVLMYLGSNLLKPGVAKIVADFERDRPNCQILLTPVPNLEAFGVAEVDEHGGWCGWWRSRRSPRRTWRWSGSICSIRGSGARSRRSPPRRGEARDHRRHPVAGGERERGSPQRGPGWWKDTGREGGPAPRQRAVIDQPDRRHPW